uniref:(northern house mosquito) hypothetical protein n=1 Tax=Culex pipiens TaxID=7175 RepID=A0A8D7ZU98_CULPI
MVMVVVIGATRAERLSTVEMAAAARGSPGGLLRRDCTIVGRSGRGGRGGGVVVVPAGAAAAVLVKVADVVERAGLADADPPLERVVVVVEVVVVVVAHRVGAVVAASCGSGGRGLAGLERFEVLGGAELAAGN